MHSSTVLMNSLSRSVLLPLVDNDWDGSFIVVEYLDRGTLRQRLDAARGGLGFWPAVRHALELASAMKYLHYEAIPGT